MTDLLARGGDRRRQSGPIASLLLPVLFVVTGCAAASRPASESAAHRDAGAPVDAAESGEATPPPRLEPLEAEVPTAFERYGIGAYRLSSPGNGPPAIYLSKRQAPREMVVLLQGSGCRPVISLVEHGGARIPMLFSEVAGDWRETALLLVEKRGVVPLEPAADSACGDEYHENATLPVRVHDVRLAMDAALASFEEPPERVVLVGVSEGSDVAVFTAADDARVTDLVLLGGGGAGQVFELLLFAHQADRAEGDDLVHLQRRLASYERIFADPEAADRFHRGHAYRRWSSFSEGYVDPLMRYQGPVLVLQGGRDESTAPESTLWLIAEMLRLQRPRVDARLYGDLDHLFLYPAPDAEARREESHGMIAHDIRAWLDREPLPKRGHVLDYPTGRAGDPEPDE